MGEVNDSKNSTGTARGIHYSYTAQWLKYSNHKYVMHTTNNSSLQFIPQQPLLLPSCVGPWEQSCGSSHSPFFPVVESGSKAVSATLGTNYSTSPSSFLPVVEAGRIVVVAAPPPAFQ